MSFRRSHALRPWFARRSTVALAALVASVVAGSASASPVLLAGTGTEKVHSTHVVLLQNGDTTVVTVQPDYQGPLAAFAVVLPVPKDVTIDRVAALKREFVDRVDSVSAPRFAEFWEQDPCDFGPVEQDWERNMKADDSSAMLGVVKTDPSKAVAKELLLDVKSQTKEGEYRFQLAAGAAAAKDALRAANLSLPPDADGALSTYEAAGYQFLIAFVDHNRLELVGGDRAQLSPIRFFTTSGYSTIPARFGLASAAPKQELLVYTLAVDQRMQVKNYPTKPAPTNLTVENKVTIGDREVDLKERMSEFYAALHDRYLEKNPGTFLLEYAYSTADCGKPCPTEPLLPHELMSLGGDVIDAKLDKATLRPSPGEPTEEEKQKLAALLEGKTPKEKADLKKEWEEERKEIAARKALLARHKYVLSRLHYRYGKTELPNDPELAGGAAVKGGVALPKGQDGAADPALSVAEENTFQTRVNSLHPDISVLKCDAPQRYKWGKPPRTYRGLRKTWVAEDLTRKNRTQVKLEDVLVSAVGDLGWPGKGSAPAPAASASAAPVEAAEGGKCGCHAAGVPVGAGSGLVALALGALTALRRRR